MLKCLMPHAIGIRNATLEQALGLAKGAGFDAIDFSIAEIGRAVNSEGIDAVRAKFEASGVKLGCFGLPVQWRGDEAQYKEQLAALPAIAKMGLALGCNRCNSGIGPSSETMAFDENLAWHVARLRPVAQVLADAGLRLGLEFLGPKHFRVGKKYEFIYTMGGTLDFAAKIGTGNVGLLLDAWHLYTGDGTIADLDRITKADVVTVHVNDAPAGIAIEDQRDNVRLLPMESGVIDLVGFMGALKKVGFDGPVIVEPFSARVNAMPAEQAVATAAESLGKLWAASGL
jgi:sugar phosphate isomerase/epimerase